VRFLRNVQRLLAEGQFTASYKFALVHALADLAVLRGDDSGAPLRVETREIAARFVELYWRQARPFPAGGAAEVVLAQNAGRQAAIVSQVAAAQAVSGRSLFRFRQEAGRWNALVTEAERVVRTMPLWKLQTVGREPLAFLYENVGRGSGVTLRPGVAYCLRAFYGLVRDLIEGAWVRFVQRLNADRLGGVVDLGTSLFGEGRASLEAYRPILADVQDGRCLYCGRELTGPTRVDHFVPWSRYPADVGHNLVLAHERCNAAKSDFLAAEAHLAAWVRRNRERRAELGERLAAAGLAGDPAAAERVARWVYRQTATANGQVWVAGQGLTPLTAGWEGCFDGRPPPRPPS
jgi:hypothetical protein